MESKPNINAVEDEVRNTINWLSVFAEEYDIPEEAVNKLREKLEDIAKKAAELTCN